MEASSCLLDRKFASIQSLVDVVVDRLEGQFADNRARFRTHLSADLLPVLVDEDHIWQVLLNLLGNALQYTPAGGDVTIRGKPQDDAVLIAISDTGIGIPSEHLSRLFTRFYRVDKSRSRAGGGSGIGLTISKHLVEAHGGQIHVDSPGPDQGSTFSFTLPIARDL